MIDFDYLSNYPYAQVNNAIVINLLHNKQNLSRG